MHNDRYLSHRMRTDLIDQTYGQMGQWRSRHAMIGRSSTTEMYLGLSTFEPLLLWVVVLESIILIMRNFSNRNDVALSSKLGEFVYTASILVTNSRRNSAWIRWVMDPFSKPKITPSIVFCTSPINSSFVTSLPSIPLFISAFHSFCHPILI